METPETTTNVYPLDDAAIEQIQRIQQQIRDANMQLHGMLNYFANKHGLQGPWKLAENGKELILT